MDLGGGWFSYNFNFRGRRVNFTKLGQALYKIGLALVALGEGQEAACSDQYASACTFIRTGQARPNNYLVRTTIKPQGRVQVAYYHQNGGTIVLLDLYGFVCFLNLVEQPKVELNDQLEEHGFELWPPDERRHTSDQ